MHEYMLMEEYISFWFISRSLLSSFRLKKRHNKERPFNAESENSLESSSSNKMSRESSAKTFQTNVSDDYVDGFNPAEETDHRGFRNLRKMVAKEENELKKKSDRAAETAAAEERSGRNKQGVAMPKSASNLSKNNRPSPPGIYMEPVYNCRNALYTLNWYHKTAPFECCFSCRFQSYSTAVNLQQLQKKMPSHVSRMSSQVSKKSSSSGSIDKIPIRVGIHPTKKGENRSFFRYDRAKLYQRARTR